MLKDRILDWKNRQLLKLGKRLIRMGTKSRVTFNQVSDDNFKQICDATNDIDNIHISDELMENSKFKISELNDMLQSDDKDANFLAYAMICTQKNLDGLSDSDIALLHISTNNSKLDQNDFKHKIDFVVKKRMNKMTFEERSRLIKKVYVDNYNNADYESK